MPVTYVEVKREDCQKYANCEQAAHCMVYSRLPDMKFLETYELKAAVLMQMRFDGHVGFPGGLIEDGEEPIHGLIREMDEEINFLPQKDEVNEISHVGSYWNSSEKILLHFYALEVSQSRIREIERKALEAHDYGGEVMGTFRVPLYTMHDGVRGFPTFLKNSFIGNACQELKAGLLHAAILSKEEIGAAEAVVISSSKLS
ncbi:U8 snoRNA-decapping enzyme-like [Thrips palmi]|uniref:U8 snoRNA-decapping enzyme n=1 Tax=Thrips palmi TaxID=161013 RepID=A0A6P8Z9F4_THRPL|nr:U8 snoRNA-decapping enzyme-like [Thrips palmi]